jgi:peroxiredoxin
MMVRKFALSLAVALVGLSTSAFAADLATGDKAPEIKGLPGVDGKDFSLSDAKDAKVIVVCFTCNICPMSVAYEDRFIEFNKKYAGKGVKFVAINVNQGEDVKAMKQRAEEKGFNFPYVYDKSQDSARSYGAMVTPHMFVLNKDRTVAYVGSFDDNKDKPTKHYVADAVDALLTGKKVEVSSTRAFGCNIGVKPK